MRLESYAAGIVARAVQGLIALLKNGQTLVLNLLVNLAMPDSPDVAPNPALTCWLVFRSRLIALLV